jgi:hypothetical protein
MLSKKIHLLIILIIEVFAMNAFAGNDVKFTLLFDGSYSEYSHQLTDALEVYNLQKVLSKGSNALEIRMINDTEMLGSLNHTFDGGRVNCKLDPKSTRCSPCQRLANCRAEGYSETIVLVDVNRSKWIQTGCTNLPIEQIGISENLDFYKDYYSEYAKMAKKDEKTYHIVIWWPSSPIDFNLVSSEISPVKYGTQVDCSLETSSPDSYEVIWTVTDEKNKTTTTKTVASVNVPAKCSAKVVGPILIEAAIPVCNIKKTMELQPDEICEEIDMSVILETDDRSYMEKWRLLKTVSPSEQAEYEILRYSGSSNYIFKVPRQCGVDTYALYVSRFGEGNFKEIELTESSQISDDPKSMLLSGRFTDIERNKFLESDDFGGLCEIYIAPKKYDKSLRLIGAKGDVTTRVVFQKCS